LRRPEARLVARQMADALLRADGRRARAAAMPKLTKKATLTVTAGPQPIRLADLKRALAVRDSSLQSVSNRAGGSRHDAGEAQ
jgi:hypothetical protein